MPRDIRRDSQSNVNVADLPVNKADCQLVWLDESSYVLKTQEMLQLLNTKLQVYTDVEKCFEFIQSIKTENILLIVSGQFASMILPRIHNLRSLRAVFIFCEMRDLYTALLVEYSSKIIDIFTDRDALFKSISETMKLIEKQDAMFQLFDRTQKSTRDLSKESASFLWYQLLMDVLKKMPADEQAKNEMLDYCAAYYRHNTEELEKLERFGISYTPNDAVRYCTENPSLYKLLNKALRTEDTELLYAFRFFIIDLCAELENENKRLIEGEPSIVYRGQQMLQEEFDNLTTKIGSLIAMNGFLSTSRDEHVALGFANSPSLSSENMIRVRITIKADPKLKTMTFADVSDQSKVRLEREVLFSFGSVFRIDACEFDETCNMGKLILTATDEGSETLLELLNAQNDQLQIYSPMIYFGRILMNEMNEIDRAEMYFSKLLKSLPADHLDIGEVYNQIGAVYYMRSEKQEALEMFEKALEIRRNTFGDNDIRIANSMNNIGSIYNDRGEYDCALDYYQRGLKIMESAKPEPSIFKGNLLLNCGIVKHRSGDKEAMISFWIQADEIFSHCLPAHHSSCARTALFIAEFYKEKSDFSGALKYYQRVYESCKMTLIPSESKFRDVWENIIYCCLKLNDKELAIIYLDRVLELCERLPLYTNETSADYILTMAKVSEEMLDFEMALNYYQEYLRLNPEKVNISEFEEVPNDFSIRSSEECIRILKFKIETYEKLFAGNDLNHSSFLVKMGEVLEVYNDTYYAHQCYQKAFEILEGATLDNNDALFNSFAKLVDICFTKNAEQSALNYLERAVGKCQQVVLDTNLTENKLLWHISRKYEQIGDINNALHYFEKVFTSNEAKKSYQWIQISLNKIFEICVANGKEQVVSTYVQRATNIYEKDPVKLSECYRTLGNSYAKKQENIAAFQYYEQFLLATEVNNSSFTEKLDDMWIDFVVMEDGHLSLFTDRVFRLLQLQELCNRCLSPHHFKTAIVSWMIGYLHEGIRVNKVARKFYREAIAIWEKLIYNRVDKRTEDALVYFINRLTDLGDHLFLLWNISFECSLLEILDYDDHSDKWELIIQRLKILKMISLDNQWGFHLKLECNVLQDDILCSKIVPHMLKVCNNKLYCVENNTSVDINTIICCLELISHWYLKKKQYPECLLHRQHQLELETKFFSSTHHHVGWSLWFIGLIFQKMHEYDSSLGYFTRALNIFQSSHPKEHKDIQTLEEHIAKTKQTIHEANTSQITKRGEIAVQTTDQI